MLHAAAQHGRRAFREAPARRHLARLHHAGGGEDPQFVGQAPARDQVELGLAVEALLQLRQLPQHAAVGKEAALLEVPAGALLEERALRALEVRLVHRDQVALDLRLAPEQPLALGEQVVDAQVVAQEVRARGLAFDHHRPRRAVRITRALGGEDAGVRRGVRAQAPVVLRPAGGVHAEARDGAGHLVRHRTAAHREQPGGCQFLQSEVFARFHGAARAVRRSRGPSRGASRARRGRAAGSPCGAGAPGSPST